MFLRKLEKRECTKHRGRTPCRTAFLMECEECQTNFVVHGNDKRARVKYCSPACRKIGTYKVMATAEENRKRYVRTKFGDTFQKPAALPKPGKTLS